MRRLLLLVALLSALGGCMALPAPVQLASLAFDGISMIATEKSLTDHGLSLIAGKDCAVWRGLTEGNLCQDRANDDDAFTLSDATDTTTVMDLETAMAEAEAMGQGFELPPGMARPTLSLPHLEIM